MSVPVSVIVPTYNRASLIGETLESILDQSGPPAEVIVVDDGSTDETEAVVRRFPSTVRYHRIENAGSPNARNVGVAHAQSPWIAFCDSDDLWTRDKLAKQLALHEQTGVEYSFTNFRIVSEGTWTEQTKFDTAPPGFFDEFLLASGGLVAHRPYYDDLLRFQPVFPSTVLISKDLFRRVGSFKPELGRVRSEDWEFTLRCVQHYPIGVVTEPVVGIRKHNSNISGDGYKQVRSEVGILLYALANHSVSQRSRTLIAEQIIERSIEAGGCGFDRGDLEGCTKWYSSVPRPKLDRKARLKLVIASSPKPIGALLRELVLGLAAAQRLLLGESSKVSA